ncbi:MAG: hypothetical protein ABSG68_18205 [Thermoguttaceae bacterium]|jgi:hypothetical protein
MLRRIPKKVNDRIGLPLHPAERTLLLGDRLALDGSFLQVIRETPPGESVHLTLDELDQLADDLADESHQVRDKTLERQLHRICQRLGVMLDLYIDLE